MGRLIGQLDHRGHWQALCLSHTAGLGHDFDMQQLELKHFAGFADGLMHVLLSTQTKRGRTLLSSLSSGKSRFGYQGSSATTATCGLAERLQRCETLQVKTHTGCRTSVAAFASIPELQKT